MRRGTAITLIVLFFLLVVVAIAQLRIAGRDRSPLPGPTSPGQLPPQPSATISP